MFESTEELRAAYNGARVESCRLRLARVSFLDCMSEWLSRRTASEGGPHMKRQDLSPPILEVQAEGHLDLARAADGFVYVAQTKWAIVEATGFIVRAAAVGSGVVPCVGKPL